MRLSVVTPFYNTARYLEQCIDSVLSQSYSDFEYVLSDNASDDGSSEIALRAARRDSRVRYVRHERHLPQVANYNRALGEIDPRATHCKIMQADDWLCPGALKLFADAAVAYPEAAVVCGGSCDTEGRASATPLPPSGRYSGREIARRMIADHVHLTGTASSVMYRADHVRNARGSFFDESSYQDDTDAFLTLARDHDVVFISEPTVFLRTHAGSISDTLVRNGGIYVWRYWQVEKFAPMFFEGEELAGLQSRAREIYFWYLSDSALRLRPPAFWRVHLRALRALGVRDPWRRILGTTAARLARVAARSLRGSAASAR